MTNLDPENVRKAQIALDKVARVWTSFPGVISVEVARRWKDGAPGDELGIRVTVEDAARARDEAGNSLFPQDLEGTPVDIVTGVQPSLE